MKLTGDIAQEPSAHEAFGTGVSKTLQEIVGSTPRVELGAPARPAEQVKAVESWTSERRPDEG